MIRSVDVERAERNIYCDNCNQNYCQHAPDLRKDDTRRVLLGLDFNDLRVFDAGAPVRPAVRPTFLVPIRRLFALRVYSHSHVGLRHGAQCYHNIEVGPIA